MKMNPMARDVDGHAQLEQEHILWIEVAQIPAVTTIQKNSNDEAVNTNYWCVCVPMIPTVPRILQLECFGIQMSKK
ncbi:hypothetical protein C0J52_08873 [Blattella germanica]|nr:hypothetical protein C0J52_08873 [Blattella germanica]